MAQSIYPTASQIELVNLLKVPFATGVIHLFSSPIAFNLNLTVAELTAIEATFTGYAAITLTAIPAAYADPINGGISQAIPLSQFNTASPYTIGNNIFGGWMDDATGNLLFAWQTATGWAMSAAFQSLPLAIVLNYFGLGANQVYVTYGDNVQ